MTSSIDHRCCSKCHHEVGAPCPDVVTCLMEGPTCHSSPACKEKALSLKKFLLRESSTKPVIMVGTATCGLAAGARKVLNKIDGYLKAKGVDAEVVEVGCIGLCSAEPIMDIQMPGRRRVSFSEVTEKNVESILGQMLNGEVPKDNLLGQHREGDAAAWAGTPYLDDHPFFKIQTRIVLKKCGIIEPENLEEYIAHGGYKAFSQAVKQMTPADVCNTVELSGLRGRGGGGFSTGKKWKFALGVSADQKYLICNADEGDPGAFMDRAVIEGDPFRLLEGIAIAAYAIGASYAYVYIRAEYPLAVERLTRTIAKARAFGLLGHNILDSGMNLDVSLKVGAGAFVCGEETALINSIEGKRGMPRPRPPFPAISGLFGKPTVINNVETLANLPEILGDGWEKFAAIGTKTSKGTKVFALSGKVVRTGLVEVKMGTTMRDIIFSVGGGIAKGKKYKAAQIGGPSGGCIPESCLDIAVDYESLKEAGAMMGSGGLVVMDEDTCMVDVAKFFMDFIQRESCGKCIPCREGTKRLLETLQAITKRPDDAHPFDSLKRFRSVLYMKRLAEAIKDTSLCGLGQTAPNPVLSTMRFFLDEYQAHIYEKRCPAGACADLLRFSIIEAECVGCTACAKHCPVSAIKGAPKSPHYIVQEQCIGCGVCLTKCKFHAVKKE